MPVTPALDGNGLIHSDELLLAKMSSRESYGWNAREEDMNDQIFSQVIGRQYQGALKMLRNAIGSCPDDLWNDRSQNEAPFWHHVMHTLFFTRLYCCNQFPSDQSFATASEFMQLV